MNNYLSRFKIMNFCLFFYRQMANWRNDFKIAELYIIEIAIFWGWIGWCGVNELKSDNQANVKLLAGVKFISTHFSFIAGKSVLTLWFVDISVSVNIRRRIFEIYRVARDALIHWNVELEQECLMLGFYVWIFAIHNTFSCGF